MISDFKTLNVWKEAQQFASTLYDTTEKFPTEEQYFLTNQIRRAAVSISSNIAEGTGRSTNKDYCSFLTIARASNKEIESQLHFAHLRKYLTDEEFKKLTETCNHIGKMLTNLIKSKRT